MPRAGVKVVMASMPHADGTAAGGGGENARPIEDPAWRLFDDEVDADDDGVSDSVAEAEPRAEQPAAAAAAAIARRVSGHQHRSVLAAIESAGAHFLAEQLAEQLASAAACRSLRLGHTSWRAAAAAARQLAALRAVNRFYREAGSAGFVWARHCCPGDWAGRYMSTPCRQELDQQVAAGDAFGAFLRARADARRVAIDVEEELTELDFYFRFKRAAGAPKS
eukprot:SAG11_NODE_2644_length_3136_cov_37.261442_3_plen_222_part_00